jgi:hypothetical protein
MNAMRRIDRFTTPLSERAALRRGVSGLVRGLARLSLVLVGSGMTAGCIIEDPPPYTQPEQTPPRLDLRKAVPLVDQIIVASRNDRIPFNVPVASEDEGDDLIAHLLLNYQGESGVPTQVGSNLVEASTLDDTTREIEIDWTIDPSVLPGCQRLTLLVSHRLNFDPVKFGAVLDTSDVALAVWWANINPTAGSADMLMGCPLATRDN